MAPKGKDLTRKVYEIICHRWPIHPSGICRIIGLELTVSNISKIKYHFDILKQKEMIHTKQIDRALVAWPAEIDKIRVVHEMMKGI